MTPAYLTAYSLTTCLGAGVEKHVAALRQGKTGLTRCDFEDAVLDGYIGRVAGIENQPLPTPYALHDSRLNRLSYLALQQDGIEQRLRAAIARYGADRVALLVGTSTSGILNTEQAYRERDASGNLPDSYSHIHSHDHFAGNLFLQDYLGIGGVSYVVSTACSSSAKIVVDAAQLLDVGLADAVIALGVDSLCLTTLYGFNSLELVSPDGCRPCDAERKGIAIGEAAAIALVERQPAHTGQPPVKLAGYGESSDGYHMSSPRPDGAGAVQAMQQALQRAAILPSQVDYINLHGTGTPVNDKAETTALCHVFGDETLCSSTKGATGHSLGAAGLVEAVISALCIANGFVPASIGMVRKDPHIRARVVEMAEDRPIKTVLTNSIGFGGNNCSLVLQGVEC